MSVPHILKDGVGALSRQDLDENFAAVNTGQTVFADLKATNAPAVNDAIIVAAMTAARAMGGGIVELPAGRFNIDSVVFTYSVTDSISIKGAGEYATRLTKSTANTNPAFNFGVVGAAPNDIYSEFSDFSLIGNAKISHGFNFSLLATFKISRVVLLNFDTGFNSVGSLVYSMHNVTIQNCNVGMKVRKNGAIYGNLLTLYSCKLGGNTTHAFDIGDSSGIKFIGCDIENNGTPGNAATGAFRFRSTCADESGFSIMDLDATWIEANFGTSIITESGGTGSLFLDITSSLIIGSESGRAITAAHTGALNLKDTYVVGNTSVINATCGYLDLQNVVADTVTDSATTGSLYKFLRTSGGTTHFQLNTTLQGLGVPKMTTAQKLGIVSPNNGSLVYDTTLNKLCVNIGGVGWQTVTST